MSSKYARRESPGRRRTCSALLLLWALLAVGTATGKDSYVKDTQVRLKRPTPLNFVDKPLRTGAVGEIFSVLKYNPETKRVYMLAFGPDGKPVAINVPEDSLEIIQPDLVQIASSVAELCRRADFAAAKQAANNAAAAHPGNEALQRFRDSVLTLETAENRLAKAKLASVATEKRVKVLIRNAELAAQPNALNAEDRSGEARAQASLKAAEDLAQATLAEHEAASAAQVTAAAAFKSMVAELKSPCMICP